MARRAVIVTSVPKNREHIRRDTREGLGRVGIQAAVESYLQGAAIGGNEPTPPKR